MDLRREKDCQGVRCLCTQHNSQGDCLLRSFSLTHFNLDCHTTDNINIWWLLIAQNLYTSFRWWWGVGWGGLLLFRSIHVCNNCILQGLSIDMREMCSSTMRQRPRRRRPLSDSSQWQSKHSFLVTLLTGTKSSLDWPASRQRESLISASGLSLKKKKKTWTTTDRQRKSITVYNCNKKVHFPPDLIS